MNSVVLYVAVAMVVGVVCGRRAGLVTIVLGVSLAVLIALSRVYPEYHYLSDVVGGLLGGAAWLLIASALIGAGLSVRQRRT